VAEEGIIYRDRERETERERERETERERDQTDCDSEVIVVAHHICDTKRDDPTASTASTVVIFETILLPFFIFSGVELKERARSGEGERFVTVAHL
jgi:hypothetical protein